MQISHLRDYNNNNTLLSTGIQERFVVPALPLSPAGLVQPRVVEGSGV